VRITPRGIAATAAASATLFAIGSAPASAEAKIVDGYCSPTGDYCTSVVRRSDQTFFGISTFSFTGRYTLCTRTADGADRECKRFRLHKDGDMYRSFVKFTAHFSPEGSQRYCASWHKFGTRLGPRVCFAFTGA
jgi:hypothetical protein